MGADAARPRASRGACGGGGGGKPRHVVRRPDASRRSTWPPRSSSAPRSSRSGWSTAGPRRPCRCFGWPAASPAGTRSIKFAGCYHGHVDALLAVRRLRAGHAGYSGHAGSHRRDHRGHHRAAVQRPGGGRRDLRDVRRRDRRGDHRGRARQHGRDRAGRRGRDRLQRVPGRHRPRSRRAVRLRRGDDRVPGHPLRPVRPGRRARPT